jgi:hypothetical protein
MRLTTASRPLFAGVGEPDADEITSPTRYTPASAAREDAELPVLLALERLRASQSSIPIAHFRQGMASCLKDQPEDHHFPAKEMLPGVMYNGDDQCRLRYRPDARQCDMGVVSRLAR